jgi:hypothetical protein
MKASTTLRRAMCITATALTLTAAGGCRGGQGLDDAARAGIEVDKAARAGAGYYDDAARASTRTGRGGEWRVPSLDQLRTGADALCKANEQRTGNDSPDC